MRKREARITRIWMGLSEESIIRITGDRDHGDVPAVKHALDEAVDLILAYLRAHGLEVESGHDGPLRTLDFKSEADCLDAHERLTAAAEGQGPFKLRFVLRPSGVTVLVIT